MALDEIIAHHGGVATGQFRRDLEPVFQRIEGVLLDILDLDLESGLPDMIDPGGTASAGRGFDNLYGRCGIGHGRKRDCGGSAGQ
jgi:hypothetical protein